MLIFCTELLYLFFLSIVNKHSYKLSDNEVISIGQLITNRATDKRKI